MSRARAAVAAACCCSIFFAAYARRIGIDGQRIDLRFISRRSGRPVENGHPPLSVSSRTLFRVLPVSAAPFVVRVSHASSRGVIHLSTRSCSHSTPARDADSHSTTRRLAHRNFSLSIRALFFFSSFTLSCDMCAKSESRLAAIGYYLRQNGDEREEASIRHILRSLRIPSTISEFMSIWPKGEVDATFQSAKFPSASSFVNSLDELRRILENGEFNPEREKKTLSALTYRKIN